MATDLALHQRDYLLRLARILNSGLELRDVLGVVLRSAVAMTGSQAGAVALRNAEGGLAIAASYRLEGRMTDFIGEQPVSQSWPLFSDEVLDSPSEVLPASDEADRPEPAWAEGGRASAAGRGRPPGARTIGPDPFAPRELAGRQLLRLPLSAPDRAIGELLLVRGLEAALFSSLDESVLDAFADQAAVAIGNALRLSGHGPAEARPAATGDVEPSPSGTALAIARSTPLAITASPGPSVALGTRGEGQGTHRGRLALTASPLHDRLVLLAGTSASFRLWLADFEHKGARLLYAASDTEAVEQVRALSPDLVLIDADDGRIDPAGLLASIHERSAVPVIVVTPPGDEPTRLRLLDLGADDVLVQPVSRAELVSRAQAVLRRASPGGPPTLVWVDEDLQIDYRNQTAIVRGQTLHLRPTEWRLLRHLVENAGWLMTYEVLLARVWGPEYVGEDHYVRLYVSYLRKKLERDPSHPRYILTEHGMGYRFRSLESAPANATNQRPRALTQLP